ncbi:hypothetical protein PYDG_00102 [Pseudoalteromonas phage pYD6-A]|uniref:Uncharacterized protein n=1 Tax=Pseudoalteromonas phage pYD6-A TaxID=754052 RepID=M4T3U1_9CAUD|nr:hypothetical protein PYDG_00002 [Pseudoalteromonas phage pYD6-A]YP_007674309.1 hypothetical protein PYDG_00102 [Pseudoalteromonas phage pYD6-A]AGH57534.1 hypothetical protein PYDG_00002 [Pseudoalteromonas phage pYD6-A]AGH57631.1 hypothetical protein PYDG_00102 [Pseudoalteromonas phage pYD6-A]
MNDYFTDEIIEELESIEHKAKRNWKIAWEAERKEEVESIQLPSWFKKKAP